MSEGPHVLPLSLLFLTPDLSDGQSAPSQKYTGSLVLGQAGEIHSDISPIPPLILRGGGKKCEIRFSTPVAFDEL